MRATNLYCFSARIFTKENPKATAGLVTYLLVVMPSFYETMRKRTKSQSAMEYLMTYGWAILIIAVVLGALFQLGVFNSSSFSPRAPPGACQVFRPSGPGTTTNINLMGVCTGQLPQYIAQFSGGNTHVTVVNTAALDNLGVTSDFSIGVWIEILGVLHDSWVVSRFTGGTPGEGYILYISQGSSRIYWDVRVDGSTSGLSSVISANAWHHAVATLDRTAKTRYLYLDGALVGSASYTGSVINHYADLFISGSGGSNSFNGLMENVQVYNASLSANQVQALYLEGIGGAPMKLQNLVGWWPLNGNSNDYSGNNNNGVPAAVTFTSQYGK